jgi:hypothetical protein
MTALDVAQLCFEYSIFHASSLTAVWPQHGASSRYHLLSIVKDFLIKKTVVNP